MTPKRMGPLLLLLALFFAQGMALPRARAAAGDDRKELRVEVFNREIAGFDPTDNLQTRYIQERFGDPNGIKVTFVPVLRNLEVDRLNLLMAANAAPDIAFTYTESVINNYVSLGGVTDVTALLAQYGPNIQSFLASTLPYGVWDGKQYAIPARRMSVARQGAFIRKDWLDALGLPIPTNKQEWLDAMTAFGEAKLGGEETIPMALCVYPTNVRFNSAVLTDSFITEMSDEAFYLYSDLLAWFQPGIREGYRLLNSMYHKGLISPNFALDKDGAQYQKDLVSGKAGFYIGNVDDVWRASPGIQSELEKIDPNGLFVAVDCFEDFSGTKRKESYPPNGLYLFIPSASTMAKEAVQYLDWMCREENLFFLQNGVMGKNYLGFSEEGVPIQPVPMEETPDEYKMYATDLCIVANGMALGSDALNIRASAMQYGKYADLCTQAYDYATTNAYLPPHFTVPIESISKYGEALLGLEVELFVRCISAPPEQFDEIYDALLAQMLDAGGQAILDERKAAFDAGQYTKVR